jgi:hypothetical protein
MPRIKSAVLVATAIGLLIAFKALAQAMPPGMTMHRIQAGEPDASGWMRAASTEGEFSVRLPLKFNDFTIAGSDPKAPVLRSFTVGAKSQEGIKFSATRIVYRKGSEDAKRFFARFEKGQDLGVVPERITRHSAAGRRAVDLVLRRASAVGYQRVLMLESDLFVLVVESPISYEATAQPYASPFFDSLVVGAR